MKNKNRLLAYQHELAARLRAIATAPLGTSLLAVQAAEHSWLIDLRDAGEILPVPPIVSAPLTHSWLLGMANVRSAFFAIVDFARFCGHASTPITAQSRVVLGGSKLGLPFGLVVSRILGLKRVEQLERHADHSDVSPWVSGEYRDPAGQVWKMLDMPALARDTQFRHAAM